MKEPVLATGLSGLVGSRIKELLSDKFEFTDLSLATSVDITNFDEVNRSIVSSKAMTVIHLAAKTDVDACEDDKILLEEGPAWQVNVVGTKNIIEVAKKVGKRVIYISTDFVFDGSKNFYTEDDAPNPVNWYGYTKHEGENIVLNSGISTAVVRIAYPYRVNFVGKKDFVRTILEKMGAGEKVFGVVDHIFTPTFIDDIAQALELILTKRFEGIYHVVGSQSLPAYDAIILIAKTFGIKPQIEEITRNDYFKNRAFRPFNLTLKNDKISNLGIRMRRFDEGLIELKRQLI